MSKVKKKSTTYNTPLAKCIGLTSKTSDARIIYFKSEIQKKERVPRSRSFTERKEYVRQRVNELNNQAIEFEKSNNTESFIGLINMYLVKSKADLDNNRIGFDTHRTHHTLSKNVIKMIDLLEINHAAYDLRKKHIIKILDHITYTKILKPRTINNYLRFLSSLFIYALNRELCLQNPCINIPTLQNSKKTREVMPKEVLEQVFVYFKSFKFPFFVLCLVIYYCFIRRTEICKLKVKHLRIRDHVFFIPASISKNKKDGIVTIPENLMNYLITHVSSANNEDYLFSNDFTPGPEQMLPTKISNVWSRMRNKINIAKKFQFYSLKDTGITRLFNLNIPTIKIRDQARHHDIKITEQYTPRNYEYDNLIKTLKDDF